MIEAGLAIVVSLLSIFLLVYKHRQENKPQREDNKIDKILATGSNEDVGNIIHGIRNELRNKDST